MAHKPTFILGMMAASFVGASAVNAVDTIRLSDDVELDLKFYTDLRLADASGEESWLDDRFGKTRYGDGRGGAYVAEAAILADLRIGWDWEMHANIKYDPTQSKPADIVEAYLSYKPAPKGKLAWRGRAGMFFPHISRENSGIAWTTPYTITPSAINSWVGEELRTVGLEGTAEWRSGRHRTSLSAAIYGYNDTTGTLLAFRGWAMHDVKVGAFSRLPSGLRFMKNYYNGDISWYAHETKPILEVDDKPGYYINLDYRLDRDLKLGLMWYDNRGKPTEVIGKQYSWDTRFWNFYADYKPNENLTLLAQYMVGITDMGPEMPNAGDGIHYVDTDFESWFVLGSWQQDNWRISARYDWFGVDDNNITPPNNYWERGDAVTIAGSYQISKNHTVLGEWLRTDSNRPARMYLGEPWKAVTNQFQISWRAVF